MADGCRTLSSKYFCFLSSWPGMEGSCRRCLFGRPDAGELQRDFEEIRDCHLQQSAERWNFDFKSGRPLPGRIQWTSVTTAGQFCRFPPSEDVCPDDEDDDDDQIVGGRLERVLTSTNSDQITPSATTTSPPPQQRSLPSLTGESAVDDVPPRLPCSVPSGGIGRKRRRNSRRSDAGSLKQPRHRRRSGTVHSRRTHVTTAGAARVTGQ